MVSKDEKQKLEIGKRIKAIRLNLGLDQPQFAEKVAPVAKSSNVSRWENGINTPNAKRLKSIAKLGNVSVDYLLNGIKRNTTANKLDSMPADSIENLNEALNFQRAGEIEYNEKLQQMIDILLSPSVVENFTEQQSNLVFTFLDLLKISFLANKNNDFLLSDDMYKVLLNLDFLLRDIEQSVVKKIADENYEIAKNELNEDLNNLEEAINNINNPL